jgi:hypothetical protein
MTSWKWCGPRDPARLGARQGRRDGHRSGRAAERRDVHPDGRVQGIRARDCALDDQQRPGRRAIRRSADAAQWHPDPRHLQPPVRRLRRRPVHRPRGLHRQGPGPPRADPRHEPPRRLRASLPPGRHRKRRTATAPKASRSSSSPWTTWPGSPSTWESPSISSDVPPRADPSRFPRRPERTIPHSKAKAPWGPWLAGCGGPEGNRTPDLFHAKEARSRCATGPSLTREL